MQKHQITSFGNACNGIRKAGDLDIVLFWLKPEVKPFGFRSSAPKLNLCQFAACLELAFQHVQRKQRRYRLWKNAQKKYMGERLLFVFWKAFFKSVLPKHLVMFWSRFHAQQRARVPPGEGIRGLSASCYFNRACLAVWTALLTYVHVRFDVNRNLILHFLIVSWSFNNVAFCASRIVDISAWVHVFVF